MKVEDLFVLICTEKVPECRDFYVKHFGFEVAFDTPIYVQLRIEGESGGGFSLAFMPLDHPFGETYRERFSGKGAYLTIQVADAEKALRQVEGGGAPIVHGLRDEAWGQRHFVTRDPNGTVVDVVQSIEPEAGYYDRFGVA